MEIKKTFSSKSSTGGRPSGPSHAGGYSRSSSLHSRKTSPSRSAGAPHASSFGRGRPNASSHSTGRPAGGHYSSNRAGGGRPGGSRPSGGRSSGRGKGQHIDISKFINKTVIMEEAVVFTPDNLFNDFQIEERLKANILEKGYATPTPIQDRVIPHILHGQDVVGIANTGTGKTAAFLIPLINKVLRDPKEKIIIMAPTRELAQQIDAELKEFAKGFKIFSVCCVGGAPIGRQISDLRYFNNFIIGTPGRIKDLIERKYINLAGFNSVVLDEADRMLDMGFIADMRFMMNMMPKQRHTLFFSATLSREVEALIKDFLVDPVMVSVKTQDTARSVEQDIVRIRPGEDKIEVLHNLLIQPEFKKVLVFGRTKHGVEKLAVALTKRGFKAQSIHGDKNQGQRQRALDIFKKNLAQVLVATDVAARGLDIAGVSHVINFDIPETYDDYVHRIGRTGRAGKTGKALTFV